MKTNESRWQQRTHILPQDRSEEFAQYPYISMQELKQQTERPRKVKMLLRDFIDGTDPGDLMHQLVGIQPRSS